ncbi:MAG: orotate phosphoribosyltransferase [Dermatophilaceae bacterium]
MDDTLARDVDRLCRLTGSFELRSGKTTSEYFDKYRFEAQPEMLRRVAGAMVPLLPPDAEVLAGLELGGVPLATMLSSLTGLPTAFVRKAPKKYGTRRTVEGADVASARVAVVEDVVTTGGAVRDAVRALRELGAVVESVVCAIDRSEAGGLLLDDVGVEVRAAMVQADLDAARRHE